MSVAEVITGLLDASTMSCLLQLAMVKYKGRLQFNASGAGSFTMLEVAGRLGLNVERAKVFHAAWSFRRAYPHRHHTRKI